MSDLGSYCEGIAGRAQAAARILAKAPGAKKNQWLLKIAAALDSPPEEILIANRRDRELAGSKELTSAQMDRLRLNVDRLRSTAAGLRQIAALPDPIGRLLDSSVRPNGLVVQKVGVPLGVIFFIYESRPNVTLDAAGLCVKSGNAVILRGGSEALETNTALVKMIRQELVNIGLPVDAVQLVHTTDRDAVGHLLRMSQKIDLAIPRGGEDLIRRVAEEARMPVLKHYKGNCHVYVDQAADFDMAERIVVNAKCQRPGVCNAAESLLIHQSISKAFLPAMVEALRRHGVEVRGCEQSCRVVSDMKPATSEDFAAEYLDLIMSVKIVADLDEAIDHIERYGSHHSDAIVTNDLAAARRFTAEVDSSAVLVNASTRFNDGFEFGLGAEIGISTDKFHARGPCGLQELTSYKYIVSGEGQVRES
jgi:glutamate-5-semialdehyde dehydrogenase